VARTVSVGTAVGHDRIQRRSGESAITACEISLSLLSAVYTKLFLNNCVFFFFLCTFPQLLFNTSVAPTDPTYQVLAFSSNHKSELWRFLTYSLLHAGTAHLIINIILQLVIALPLETEIGHTAVTLVYFGGVVWGSLAASLSNDGLLMVGASSGIYGLLMSHLSHLYLVSGTG
jgi:membrane associated rhomboid family serine protease